MLSVSDEDLQAGTYNITLEDIFGYLTPITVQVNTTNVTLPFNESFSVSVANLTISLKNAFDDSYIYENSSISVSGVGTFTTVTANISLVDITLTSGSYTASVVSENFTYAQTTFSFTNQEILEITLYVYPDNQTNLGTAIIDVYDGFSNTVGSADVRIQEYKPATGSFVEIGQATTDGNGRAEFPVILEDRTYRFFATGTVDGVSYTGYSIEGGAIIYVDQTIVPIYLSTVPSFQDSNLNTLTVNVSNTTLVQNISWHSATFYESTGVNQHICLAYYNVSGIVRNLLAEDCENAPSGTVSFDAGYNLTGMFVDVEVYNKNTGFIYYKQNYVASEDSFEYQFGAIIKILILVALITALGLALYLKRIDIFVYLFILSSIVWSLVAPSFVNAGMLALNIVTGLAILYLAQKRSGGEII